MRGARPAGPSARRKPFSFVEAAALGLLFLVPVLFYRGTEEIFEVPKVALLLTGALGIAAWALGRAWSRLARERFRTLAEIPRRATQGFRRDPLGLAILLYLVSCLASTIASPNPAESFFGAPESTAGLRTALATTVVYFAFRSRPGTPKTLDRIVAVATAAGTVAAGYGLLQAIGSDPLGWGRTASYGASLRVFGTLGHPNFLGAYLAMTFPLILHGASRARGAARVGYLLAGAICVVALVTTLSRGAWIGFAVGAIAWVGLRWIVARSDSADEKRGAAVHPPRSARLVPAILTGAVALALGLILAARSPLGAALGDRLHELVDPRAATTQTRVHIWAAGLRMLDDHPLLGVGLDQFGSAFPAYRTTAYWRLEWGATPAKAHNEAIQILATQGWLGGLAALLVAAMVVVAGWRALRARSIGVRQGAVAVLAALAAFLAQDLVSFTVVGIGVLAAALGAWLSAAAAEREGRAEAAPEPAATSRGSRATRSPAWIFALAFASSALAFVPLVARPFQAQLAERRAAVMPERSLEQARWLGVAARIAPWDARYPAKQGFVYYRRAQEETDPVVRRALLSDAHAAASRAVTEEPSSATYRTNLGEILVEQSLLSPPASSVAEAESMLRRAIAADTANGQMLDRIGFALARLGRKAEARAVALELSRLYPDLGQPLGLVGLLALDQGRVADGIDTLQIALARDWRGQNAPKASAWSNLAVGCLSARRYREARDAAAEALRLDPSLATARKNLALAEGVLKTLSTAGEAAR